MNHESIEDGQQSVPALAVIIPFFQKERGLLRRAVLSILEQPDGGPLHVIIVDDASPVSAGEELADLLKGGTTPITLIRQDNQGVAGARNTGLAAVPPATEIIAFLDSDDWWKPGHLAKMRAAFAAGADFYFCDHARPGARGSSFDMAGRHRLAGPALDQDRDIFWLTEDFLDIALRNSPLAPSTCGFRRSIAPTARFSTLFRRSCEDRMFFATLSPGIRSTAFSPCRDVTFGEGVNIFASAAWGTRKGLERVLDTARFHHGIPAQLPLTTEQQAWNDQALASLHREFSENAASYILHTGHIPREIIRQYRRIDPAIARRIPSAILTLAARKIGRLIPGGRHRGTGPISETTNRSVREGMPPRTSATGDAPPQTAHVLMCCNSGYFQHIAVCLTSLLEANPHCAFDVVVLATDLPQARADKLSRSLAGHANLTLRLIPFQADRLRGLPLKHSYPPEIYARFWVTDYFSSEVERVLYLDGDMVIVGSVAPLLTLPLENHVLAAVSIPGSVRAGILGYDPADEYFNSGVMVLNLKRWREVDAREKLIEASHRLADRLNDPDQDVLNYCFHDQRLRLDYIWNAITPFFREVNDLPLSKSEILRIRRDVRIVHFNGSSKPWQYLCQHPFQPLYRQCLEQTEWRDMRPADHTLVNIAKRSVSRVLGERRAAAVSRLLRAASRKRT